jgi:hypothetical protein
VEVTERSLPDPPLSVAARVPITTKSLVWDPPFQHDRDTCAQRLRDAMQQHVQVHQLDLLKTLPDPSPELREALAIISRLKAELDKLSIVDAGLAHRIRQSYHL